MERIRVYLAGGFHTDWDIKVMASVQEKEPNKFFFLNPRRNWISGPNLTEEEKEIKDKSSGFPTYWNVDVLAVKSSQVVFANLEDYRPQLLGPGVMFELGLAYAYHIPTIVVNQIDHRYFRAIAKLFDPAKSLDEGVVKLLQYAWIV